MNNYRYEIKFVLDESSYSDALQWLYVRTNAVNRYPPETLPVADPLIAGY